MALNRKTKYIDIINRPNIKPSVLPTLYKIHEDIMNNGLTEDDLVILIEYRLRQKYIRRTTIRESLQALKELEKMILSNHSRKL